MGRVFRRERLRGFSCLSCMISECLFLPRIFRHSSLSVAPTKHYLLLAEVLRRRSWSRFLLCLRYFWLVPSGNHYPSSHYAKRLRRTYYKIHRWYTASRLSSPARCTRSFEYEGWVSLGTHSSGHKHVFWRDIQKRTRGPGLTYFVHFRLHIESGLLTFQVYRVIIYTLYLTVQIAHNESRVLHMLTHTSKHKKLFRIWWMARCVNPIGIVMQTKLNSR